MTQQELFHQAQHLQQQLKMAQLQQCVAAQGAPLQVASSQLAIQTTTAGVVTAPLQVDVNQVRAMIDAFASHLDCI